jgi:ABC-type branched-subunit amino acid transport system permease subunit
MSVGADWAVFLVDFLIHFGLLLVVALGMNWVWGWAGLPFLGSSVSVLVGGFTGDAGVALGALLVQGLRYLLILNRLVVSETLFFPLAYLESLELGALMIVFLLVFPRGLKSIWARLKGKGWAKPRTMSNADGAS